MRVHASVRVWPTCEQAAATLGAPVPVSSKSRRTGVREAGHVRGGAGLDGGRVWRRRRLSGLAGCGARVALAAKAWRGVGWDGVGWSGWSGGPYRVRGGVGHAACRREAAGGKQAKTWPTPRPTPGVRAEDATARAMHATAGSPSAHDTILPATHSPVLSSRQVLSACRQYRAVREGKGSTVSASSDAAEPGPGRASAEQHSTMGVGSLPACTRASWRGQGRRACWRPGCPGKCSLCHKRGGAQQAGRVGAREATGSQPACTCTLQTAAPCDACCAAHVAAHSPCAQLSTSPARQ